jgi:hypothetical protein
MFFIKFFTVVALELENGKVYLIRHVNHFVKYKNSVYDMMIMMPIKPS